VRLLRIYLRWRLQQARFLRLVESLSAGLWLGILSPSDLELVDDAYYVGLEGGKRHGTIDYASAEYNRGGLFGWEERAIEEYFPASGRLALLGAGGGREVLALRRRSFDVTGWECQPAFVDAANRLLADEGFEPAVAYVPRNTVPDDVGDHDGLIIGWGTYTLITGRDRRVALLRALRDKVDVGAPLLVSFYPRRPADGRFRIAATLANAIRRVLGRDRAEVGDYLDPNLVHLFTQDELAAELTAGGFALETFAERPYGHAVARAVAPASDDAAGDRTRALA
jgi:hypothetical protein